jgi:hypothetical protein
MTVEHGQDLAPAKRRRLIVQAGLRSALIAAVLVVLYYVLPLDRPWDSDTAVRLLVFAGVMGRQVRTIAASRYPGVRAAEALGLVIPLFLVLFASTSVQREPGGIQRVAEVRCGRWRGAAESTHKWQIWPPEHD